MRLLRRPREISGHAPLPARRRAAHCRAIRACRAAGPAPSRRSTTSLRSVNLDGSKDLPHEPVARVEADRARHHEEDERRNRHVPEEEEARDKLFNLELGCKVKDRIEEEVARRRAAREEGAPPPVVVLGAELEVAHDDRDLGARQDEDEHDEEEEAKDIVELVQPDRAQDEEELDEHRAERQHAAHDDGEGGLHVPRLLRHLPRDLVGPDREVRRFALVPKVGAEEDERHRDAKPEEQQRDERAERHRAGRRLAPDEEVQHEEDREDDPRVERRGEHRVLLPRRAALERLEERGGEVTGGHAHEDEEEDHCSHQPAAVRRAQQAKDGKGHRDQQHAKDLDARPNGHAQHHWLRGRTEHVAVYQLPPRLLLHLLCDLELIIPLEVAMQRSQHDHCDHSREEEDNHQ
mmetsp:Transcript_10839/g.34246  ORF Transcript_10839/g.34246 Transcript_10839/m.34246 type:complete len:406 (+) Transcript_10839:509-1726(+)